MQHADVEEARRIVRLAFGTFVGAPDPERWNADRDYVYPRWSTDPEAFLVAEFEGKLAGSNFATRWGSFGFFGPLTVRPELWNQRIAQALLGPTIDLFDCWGVREAGLFTFAHSAKHVGLYQKFGFWPRFLTAILSKDVQPRPATFVKYSALAGGERDEALRGCRAVTNSIYEGLDVSAEIRSVKAQNLGDTILLWSGSSLDAFAVCHAGEGTEAGTDRCYIKFGAARPGSGADKNFQHLLDACEAFASERGLHRMEAGVNLNRRHAYRALLEHGYRAVAQGVAMHRPDLPAYNRPDVLVIDDWR